MSPLGAGAGWAGQVTGPLLTVVFTVALGLSMGTTAMVARRIGEKDPEGAARVAEQSILLGVLISIPIAILGSLFSRQLFRAMNAEAGVSAAGGGYMAIIFGGNVVIMLLFLINAIFRGAGDAAIAMRALWFGNVINLILDPCLIFGLGPFPEMGVTGSAVATTIGRGCAVIYQFTQLFGGHSRVPVSPNRMLPDFGIMKSLLRISLGGMF